MSSDNTSTNGLRRLLKALPDLFRLLAKLATIIWRYIDPGHH